MSLYFYNNGNFNPVSMTTFGISAKENENPIGFFGTGFKYAVSIILRLGGSVRVNSNGEEYKFELSNINVRGENFSLVCMNSDNAGFTTRLGVNWEPWQAYRELKCNCDDENGIISREKTDGYDTVITVDCPEMEKVHNNANQYFIVSNPIYSGISADLHDKPSDKIFYKGVAIYEINKPSLYSYNITDALDLTEDRTAKYDYQIQFALKRTIQNLKDTKIIKRILRAADTLESTINYDVDFGYSDEFAQTCREMLSAGIPIGESARKLLSSIDEKSGNWPEISISEVQRSMLNRARLVLKSININIDKYPILVVEGLGEGVMGRALDGVIYISEIPFNMGTKQVAGTLLEEFVHNEHGCKDFDRAMQNWLFDKIMSLTEELNGEPI